MRRDAVCAFALALVSASCGGPNQNDPVRYGTVRVALAPAFSSMEQEDLRRALSRMSAVGPSFVEAATGETPDVTLTRGADLNCQLNYFQVEREVRLGHGCFVNPLGGPTLAVDAAQHALGHWVGLQHVEGTAVMNLVAGEWDGSLAGGTEMFGGASSSAPTELDLAEYRRVHP